MPLYIFRLQETVIRTLADFGIGSRRDVKYVGVWVGDDKIAVIGVAIHKWITITDWHYYFDVVSNSDSLRLKAF